MKVFSCEQFKKDCKRRGGLLELAYTFAMQSGWPQDCEGKTANEIEKLGYTVMTNWMTEKESTR